MSPPAGSEEMDLDKFYWAVEKGDVQIVRRGLEAGVDVNVKRDWRHWNDSTPLHVASKYGQTEVAELLIEHKAEVDARAELLQSTPLHWAALMGRTGTCELLIRHGADVMARNKLSVLNPPLLTLTFPPVQIQNTPLHRAALEGHTGTCELLIRHGADVMARAKLYELKVRRHNNGSQC
ncbi:GA-binding protein subunit beta-2-like [Branchiostoma floridae]|uniref:GA-binding protein subunit beta-2-like n=1 Tax=Branchiostoma floridae TaxID=7739 RepID=A0A9J7MU35_BRAFL|nr:GA-binding protein subunit beta-2-like [Branchiostoma floridae]